MSESEHKGRLIKKYPNRRLYDTEESRYITLQDVEALVLGHVPFWVQDTRSKEDITRTILLQIISEREDSGAPVFSTKVLEDLVRIYGAGLQETAQSYFERSFGLWSETQALLQDHVSRPLPTDAAEAVKDLTERNLKLWQDMQANFLKAYQPASSRRRED